MQTSEAAKQEAEPIAFFREVLRATEAEGVVFVGLLLDLPGSLQLKLRTNPLEPAYANIRENTIMHLLLPSTSIEATTKLQPSPSTLKEHTPGL